MFKTEKVTKWEISLNFFFSFIVNLKCFKNSKSF